MTLQLSKEELNHYLNVVIPALESDLSSGELSDHEMMEKYNLYLDVLRIVAVDDFETFNKYLEIDEDHNDKNKAFYGHRKTHVKELFESLNDMEIHDAYDTLLISMPPRIGKALDLDTKVLTPDGWIRNGDIVVGQKVIGSNGKPITVQGVFPQGKKSMYNVEFDDGTIVKASGDHLWTVKTRDDRRRNSKRTVTTESMLKNLYVENGIRKNYSIEYVKPVEFNNNLTSYDLHPYLLGCLIGDGGLGSVGVKLTNIDGELLEKCSSLIPDSDKITRISDSITYYIGKKVDVRNEKGYPIKSETGLRIKELGLDKNSHEKFIPRKYLYSSVENRIEILRGLMDTDGTLVKNGSYCEICTVSEQLSKDIIEIVRSLGGRATFSTKTGYYNDSFGKRIECKKVYRVVFNMEINPFYISRKADQFKPRKVRPYKYIKSIERIDDSECLCISVDSEDSLYIAEGYNLTHNTTTGIRFLSWIIGRHPEETQLATSYSDNITTSFYIGVMEIVQSQRFREVFNDALLVKNNAKREEIWLKTIKRYPSITFVAIRGSMTGRSEATRYLYCDDLVSGIEEALSITRLENLWSKYTVDAKQRKKDGCKEIHIATNWSVHDPMSRLKRDNADNPRCKILDMSCYDENGESNFDFEGGFSTKYYRELERTMDTASFSALYKQEPIEREGILYNDDELMRYFKLPEGRPDAIIAVADSKNLGKDHVASAIAYMYGNDVYIEDAMYDNSLPEITKRRLAEKLVNNNVTRCDVEMNNGGNYFAEGVDDIVKSMGGTTTFRLFYTGNNKDVKIISYSDFVKKRFLFKEKSMYSPNSEYAKFIKALTSWSQSGKNPFDDAPDVVAMLAQLIQDLEGTSIKVMSRRELRI